MKISDFINIPGITTKNISAAPVASQPVVDTTKLGPKEVYLQWEAAGRPMQHFGNVKLSRSFAIIGVVIVLFLVILQEYFLILVVASLLFVSQVLSKTPPEVIKYELSSYGLTVDNRIYYWQELRRFFFFNHDGFSGVAVDLVSGIPSRLFVTLGMADPAKVKEILGKYLQFLESAPESFMDKTYKSVTQKFTS